MTEREEERPATDDSEGIFDAFHIGLHRVTSCEKEIENGSEKTPCIGTS